MLSAEALPQACRCRSIRPPRHLIEEKLLQPMEEQLLKQACLSESLSIQLHRHPQHPFPLTHSPALKSMLAGLNLVQSVHTISWHGPPWSKGQFYRMTKYSTDTETSEDELRELVRSPTCYVLEMDLRSPRW